MNAVGPKPRGFAPLLTRAPGQQADGAVPTRRDRDGAPFADDRAVVGPDDEVRRRVAWARAAQERAGCAARRLLWAQGFSTDAKHRAAAARRAVDDRRPPGRPG